MCIINIVKNNYKKLWFSFLINLLLLLFIIVLFVPVFETNDDTGMKFFVSGEYGIYDYHIVFSNVILGYILVFLYKIINFIPWYELMHYLFIYLSLSFITYIVLNKSKSIFLSLVFVFLFSIDLYARLQFTKTASILAISGGFLLIDSVLNKQKNKLLYVSGMLLIICGFMVRTMQCVACLGILVAFSVPFYKKMFTKQTIVIGVILILLCGICYFANKKSYSSPEYQKFLSFNNLRSNLLDGGFPSFEENTKEYSNLGVTRNAFNLYTGWNFNDPQIFTIPLMEQIIELKQKKDLDFKAIFDKIFEFLSSNILVLFLLFYLIDMNFNKNNYTLSCILCLCCFFCMLFLILLINTGFKSRVVYPFVLELSLLFMYSYNPLDNIINKKSYYTVIIVFLVLYVFTEFGSQTRINFGNSDVNRKYLDCVSDENVYFVSTLSNDGITSNKLFDKVEFGSYSNKILLGGWGTEHPFSLYLQDNNIVTNPFVDLIDKDNAYLIASEEGCKLIIKYIEDYYYSRVDYSYVTYISNDVYMFKLSRW